MPKTKYPNWLPSSFAKPLSARTTYGQWCAASNKRVSALHEQAKSAYPAHYAQALERFAVGMQDCLSYNVREKHANRILQLHTHIAQGNMPYRKEGIAAYYDMPTVQYCMLVIAMYESYALHSYCEHGLRAMCIAKSIIQEELGNGFSFDC